ncbi:DUF1963 domain-containing protein [Myceligenerans salitolerans]|uniref:DUF1963 domain-containing protein n=1 Tax=Myceligenerans salitolerans TaxID=1230528 RepID=A0ABS3IAN2_9MICO|nr:DUF1963 domain-containing protein [Myceligenerans salitolerans]MBO0610092.1 DUF1963 domain-containing protein [Myceligenerans salitolerans]
MPEFETEMLDGTRWTPAGRLALDIRTDTGGDPAEVAWRSANGAEATIMIDADSGDFRGMRRSAGAVVRPYRGTRALMTSGEDLGAVVLTTSEGEDGTAPRGRLSLLVNDGEGPVERVTWRDRAGTVASVHLAVERPPDMVPVRIRDIVADGEHPGAGEVARNLLESVSSKWLTFSDTATIDLELAHPAPATAYRLTSADDFPDRDPRDWELLGSMDRSAWFTVDVRSAQDFPARHQTREFLAQAAIPYRFYRLDVRRNRGSARETQLQRIELLTTRDPGGTGIPVAATTARGSREYRRAGEVAVNVLDDDHGKWLSWDPAAHNTGRAHLDLELPRPAVVNAYALASANDFVARDPRDWTFEASHDGASWTVLDARAGELFPERHQLRAFTAVNAVAYPRYRLNVTANAGGETAIQLSRVALLRRDPGAGTGLTFSGLIRHDGGPARPYHGWTGSGAGTAGGAPVLTAAVRNSLAPLKALDMLVPAMEFVLRDTGPEVLTTLRELDADGVGRVFDPVEWWWSPRVAAVTADLNPGWSQETAAAGRLTLYGAAPVDVLARFGQVLHAVTRPGVPDTPDTDPSWLLALADDVMRVVRNAQTAGEQVRRRWTPDVLTEIARAGGATRRPPVHDTITALLHEDGRNRAYRRHELLDSAAGTAFLARYADVVAEVVPGLGAGGRRYASMVCGRRPHAHLALIGGLIADPEAAVRAQALTALAWADVPAQVDVLRRHLRTAPTDRLPAIVDRLADIGATAVIEEALQDVDDGRRAELLRRVLDRQTRLRVPEPVPPPVPSVDPDLAADLRASLAAARRKGQDVWPDVRRRLEQVPDVRVLRDVLRDAGKSDADRRIARLLVTLTSGGAGRKNGSALTPEGARRWWPLFAERLDLADEYLDGICEKRDVDDDPVDTAATILTVLEQFPQPPAPLVRRLTSMALGSGRHRLAARRVLADRPGARDSATSALAHGDPVERASAAEWLAGLGEPGVVAPEPGWEFGDGVLPAAVRELPAETLGWLDRFADQARADGVSPEEVDRWLGLARPALRTSADGSGPVMGRLGGPLMLPVDAGATPDGESHLEHQLILTLDLSAIPEGATDLALPRDGQLLLFANAELDTRLRGGARYVPAGVPVEERRQSLPDFDVYGYGTPEKLDARLRATGDLRLVHGVSLPSTPPDDDMLARHPRAETLRDVWSEQTDGGGTWQIGGHAANFDDYGDPVPASARKDAWDGDPGVPDGFSAPEDWVLLAQWAGFPMAIVYWTITRQDLEARRFDRVVVHMHANP